MAVAEPGDGLTAICVLLGGTRFSWPIAGRLAAAVSATKVELEGGALSWSASFEVLLDFSAIDVVRDRSASGMGDNDGAGF